MIPKIIHYCWFSGEKPQRLMRHCMDSWMRVMPDFEIKCWDINSFDFDSVPFTKEAMSVKKWASIADFIRIYALYYEGGIYLDADVNVYKNLSPLLNCDFFSGTEAYYDNNTPQYRIEAALMGAIPHNSYVGACLEHMKRRHYLNADGTRDKEVMPSIISKICADEYGYKYSNILQHLPNNIIIYPTSYFTNSLIPDYSNPDQLYAKHFNTASWMDFKDRGKFFHFCRKHDMMDIYHWVEKFKK